MKVRSDFVTNSSSSSFILGFTDEQTVKEELLTGFDNETIKFYPMVFNNSLKEDRLTKDEVLDKLRKYLYHEISWDLYYSKQRSDRSVKLLGRHNFLNLEETKNEIQKILEAKLQGIEEKMKGYDIFIMLRYSDHTDCQLEKYIMPKHPHTIAVLDHH